MKSILRLRFTLVFSMITTVLSAQNALIPSIQSEIAESELAKLSDVQELIITNRYTSKHNQIIHVYLSQAVNGIRIGNSNINAVVSQSTGKVIKVVGQIIPNPGSTASGSENIDLQSAIQSQLLASISGIKVVKNSKEGLGENKISMTITGDQYTHNTVAEKIYFHTPEGELKLAWSFDAEMTDQSHWYHYVVDADNGGLLAKYDWTVHCNVADHNHPRNKNSLDAHTLKSLSITDGSGYLVYNLPIESPIHGERTLEVEPALILASPFGWHDDNGSDGVEYTHTRGNNVHAYEDVNDANSGNPAEGGGGLEFVFDYNSGTLPSNYQQAAITNLFFTNNKVHDIMHMYGFDESAGNFQETNYSGVGLGSDHVRAEAQDGGGVNNANFATPPDGENPRMQMYLWESGSAQDLFEVNSPGSLTGTYSSSTYAGYGPIPDTDITANLVLVEDSTDPTNNGCESISNGADMDGEIALVYRGGCNFTVKVLNAQAEGAIGCVIINNAPGLMDLGGFEDGIEIPSIMITQADGELITEAMEEGEIVNATLLAPAGVGINDGSFDNGIIIHEYGHGISTRLTGGPSNVNCLFNDEQMGEGWSDFYAIALTASTEATNPVNRPMATFANGESVDGNGIRPAPYDTSFTVNPFTYGAIANDALSQPHGIGFVWATMLWDLYWAFKDEYGFDPDLYAGSGGNNMVIQLVTDGLKLQACQPGFIDGRDAILLADELNFEGANQCLIWEVFARRGLGYSADQGSSQSRYDGVEAFDKPPFCENVVNPPTALFSFSSNTSCSGFFQFTDESVDIPQLWLWDFGDGETSTEQNPGHTYAEPGVYTVSLTVTNSLGEDTESIEEAVAFEIPEPPSLSAEAGCIGDLVSLTASGDGAITWTDENDEEVGTGNEIIVELGNNPDTYYATADQFLPVFVGPEDGSIGGGVNHATDFVGTVDFQTYQPVVIQSAWVESGGTGTRTITLWNDASGIGDIVDQVAVDIDFTGGGTIELGFEIMSPGTYSIGLNQANLYRNEGGTDYPYSEEDLISIIGSSAGPDYYYYFYNLEVDVIGCTSEPAEIVTEVLGSANYTYDVDGLVVNFSDLSTGANSWNWDFGDGNTSTESDPEHTYQQPGAYTVTLTTNGTCEYTQEIVIVSVGIEDDLNEQIVLSPNPATDRIQVQIPEEVSYIQTMRLYDVSGRMVKEQSVLSNAFFVDLNALSSGTYLLQLLDDQKAVRFNDRVVISH